MVKIEETVEGGIRRGLGAPERGRLGA